MSLSYRIVFKMNELSFVGISQLNYLCEFTTIMQVSRNCNLHLQFNVDISNHYGTTLSHGLCINVC